MFRHPSNVRLIERLVNLRITGIALVDHLDGWDGLDTWLDAERTLGATCARQVSEAAKLGDGVEQRVAKLEPLMTWAQALSQNLRRFRSVGHDEKTLAILQSNAEDHIKAIHTRQGWDLPPSSNPRLQPLD